MTIAVAHHAMPMIGSSLIRKNVTVVPWNANVSGRTVKTTATTSVDVRFLICCRVASSASFSVVAACVAADLALAEGRAVEVEPV